MKQKPACVCFYGAGGREDKQEKWQNKNSLHGPNSVTASLQDVFERHCSPANIDQVFLLSSRDSRVAILD